MLFEGEPLADADKDAADEAVDVSEELEGLSGFGVFAAIDEEGADDGCNHGDRKADDASYVSE